MNYLTKHWREIFDPVAQIFLNLVVIFGGCMYKKIIFSLGLLLLVLNGCNAKPTYSEALNSRVIPTTQKQKQQECSYIRQEIARMQSSYQQASMQKCNPQYGICIAPVVMAKANNNIYSLENRASIIECDAAFSTVKIINSQNHSITECIKACKENTKRTSSECFDTCNK
ncbi:MAG: hypothetical protein Q7S59_01490 [Sulfurimonas sp.]|nr:hypothetical protein [Sulfurimonas sp.]